MAHTPKPTLAVFNEFKARSIAAKFAPPNAMRAGKWRTNAWVKRGILLGFRMGSIVEMSPAGAPLQFLDKNTYPIQTFTPEDRVRIVPGGSSIRDGAYMRPALSACRRCSSTPAPTSTKAR